MTKYLSIDTETTGLDPLKSELLEVGIIIFDSANTFQQTAYNALRIVFVKEQIQGNLFAINLNKNLLEEILTISKEFDKPNSEPIIEIITNELTTWYVDIRGKNLLDKLFISNYIDDDNKAIHNLTYKLTTFLSIAEESNKFNIAGKNFAMLDKAFLEKFSCFQKTILKKMRHRILDVGSLYITKEDEHLPDLNECLKRAGINEEVPHNAVDDARLVALTVIHKLSK